jgi:hypothetical protein
MGLRAMLFLFLPGRISSDGDSILFVVFIHIRADLRIIGLPIIQMSNEQVVVSAFEFAEGNQIVWIEFQVGVEVKWLDVVDLQALPPMTTHSTGWFFCEMSVCYRGPLRATRLVPILTSDFETMVVSS